MDLEIDPSQAHTLEQWAIWYKSEIAPSDLDNNGLVAYLHYFADLGIFETTADEGKWQLTGIDIGLGPNIIREKVLNKLENISLTDKGFALNYFLGRRPAVPSPNEDEPKQLPVKKKSLNSKSKAPGLEKASDLSNLQIVKKVGRQLQPFLEFENETVARLVGPQTQKKEARVIFNYILRHTRTEAEPKKWEQLSRKRHR
jgi:hypothetical protein